MLEHRQKGEPQVSIQQGCEALGLSRATLYREKHREAPGKEGFSPVAFSGSLEAEEAPGQSASTDNESTGNESTGNESTGGESTHSGRKLSGVEQQRILEVLHSERFVDLSPAEVYATLLDEGVYLCSMRTMYRLLSEHKEVKERRRIRRHVKYQAPELLATGAKQVWSWDITRLAGPEKWTYYSLYVVLDIFSRYVVGWMVAPKESAALAEHLIQEACLRQGVGRGQLTIHADRGPSMTSRTVTQLLFELGGDQESLPALLLQ